MSEKKIMSYPFTGFDYKQIREIGDRVRINSCENGVDVNYIIPSFDKEFGDKHEEIVFVSDYRIKHILCYFSFLNSMCRYNSEISIFRAIDQGLLSYNTYVDSILICANEIVSDCKYHDINPNYDELLYRFSKQYNSDDLNRLYDKISDYEYLNCLFKFLKDDSYLIHTGRYNSDGVYFDQISDGSIDEIVTEIINNKDSLEYFNSSKEEVNGPMLTKKISSYQVI